MFMSLDSTARANRAEPFPVSSDVGTVLTVPRPWYLKLSWLLSVWFVLSIMWGAAVGYDLYQRISMQADMSRDVEADLDAGFVNASCSGPSCGGSAATARTQNWAGIAQTYIKFGSDEMAECVFGPPAALLVIGLGTVFVLRRRPNARQA
jgi:hypothetical protein